LHTIDSNKILHIDIDHQVLFVGGPNMPTTNPIWRMAAILKQVSTAADRPARLGA